MNTAKENATDVYGQAAKQPTIEEAQEPFVPVIEAEIITAEGFVDMPQPFMAMPQARALTGVSFDNGWIIGLDDKMEYITADTLARVPEAQNANHLFWTKK